MKDDNNNQARSGSEDHTRAVIEQIWYRARINAFAHRSAAEQYTQRAKLYFQGEIVATLFSILCVIVVYSLATDIPVHPPTANVNGTSAAVVANTSPFDGWKMTFTLLSISLTLVALYLSVMASHQKLDVCAEAHRHLLNSYQYIAQRAREAKWPDLPEADVVALLKDLERDFQLLKARGVEPDDRHFDKAHLIVRKIREDRDARIAQSFEIGAVDEAAQHVGGTKNNSEDEP